MKQFIKKIVLFLSPLIIGVAFLFPYYVYMNTKVLGMLKTISNYECLIMGDSQMQRINPDFFSKSTYNFSNAGEHYFFTYQKIKKLTSIKGHNIKKIVLGVSAHNFSPIYTKLFNTKFTEGQNSIKRYFYFCNSSDLVQHIGLSESTLLAKSILVRNPEWGGLFTSNNANPDTSLVNITLKMHYDQTTDFSQSQIQYLDQIVDHCSKNNIQLVLVSTPYHPYYLKNVNDVYFNILKKTVNKYQTVHYINYVVSNFDPSLMSDGNHLNISGAKIYSKMINDSLNVYN